jgi:hypothetical protein
VWLKVPNFGVSKDGNSQFISFRVAVTENKGDDRKTTYYDVTHPSTDVLHFLKKGKSVSVIGPLSIWQSHGQDGNLYLNADLKTFHDTIRRYEKRNFSSKELSFHMSVNPSSMERMSEEKVKELVSDIMEGLGYAKQPYAIYRHNDIDRRQHA